jgi:Zn-dependent protease
MFRSSYKIATIWGIPIKIHISLIVLLAYFAFAVGISEGVRAIAFVLLLETGIFTSIALHELGHSFVAIRKGCRVREITLLFIGGAAQMDEIPRRPRDEFLMALAGPVVSILLAVLCWFAGARLPLTDGLWPLPFFGRWAIRCNIVQYLGVINLGLAIFNLLPSFPMDGGRIFRSLLARKMGRLRATFIAANLGKMMAIAFGLYGFLAHPTRWILVAIAFFIYTAASREYFAVQMQEAERRNPFGGWSPFGGGPPPSPPSSEDEVIISPSPYDADGRQRRTVIRPDDR